jgi:hypothetical protein
MFPKPLQWEQQVARRTTRIAQGAQRLDRVGEIAEAAGVYAETKIEETGGTETSVRSSGARSARKRMTRMKTIALIGTRLELPGVSLGIPRFHTSRRDGRFRCKRRFPEGRGLWSSHPD